MMRIFRPGSTLNPPVNITLSQQRDLAAEEIVGVCLGVLTDVAVSDQEACFPLSWRERNAHLSNDYPFDYLCRALHTVLTDGTPDPEVEADMPVIRLHPGSGDIHPKSQRSGHCQTFNNPAPMSPCSQIGWTTQHWGFIAMGTFLGASGQLVRDLFFSSAFWGFAGVMAGGWLTWRRESTSKRQERDRDMQFAAASLSASLARFISACGDIAGDDGTCMGQTDPDGILRAQTSLPLLDFSSLDIEWRSLQSLTVDRLLQLQNKVTDEHARLEFENDADMPPYDSYFFERRLAFVKLGIETEAVVRDLRAAAGLEPYPETRSLVFLKEHNNAFEKIMADRAAASRLPPLADNDA